MADDYQTWIRRSKSSLAISKTKSNEDIVYEDLCFQAQQAVEEEYNNAITVAEKCVEWIEKKLMKHNETNNAYPKT
jgi:HEPN domain-containing protein